MLTQEERDLELEIEKATDECTHPKINWFTDTTHPSYLKLLELQFRKRQLKRKRFN